MRVVLKSGWDRLELIDAWEPVITHVEVSSPELREYLRGPEIIGDLRSLLEELGGQKDTWKDDDDAVVDEVIRLIQLGQFRLLRTVSRPAPFAAVSTGNNTTKKGSTADKDASSVTVSQPAIPSIVSPTPVPVATEENVEECSGEDCPSSFERAAEDGTPLIQADAEGC